jgi:heme/copper-type cytochrome/quinol oxidase subunit 2
VTYPGQDGQFDTRANVTLDNELHVPAGRPTVLNIRSKDVIHARFMPNLRFQQDAVPLREVMRWIEAIKPRRRALRDEGHLIVHTPEEYAQWLKEMCRVEQVRAPGRWFLFERRPLERWRRGRRANGDADPTAATR